jgi:hypothetical protein
MTVSLSVERRARLPALAFAARITVGSPTVAVTCGAAVEVDDRGIIAGAWAGPFADRAYDRAVTAVGTGLRLTDAGIVAVVGSASASALFFSRVGPRLVIANTLAFALAAAEDQLIASYPFYTNDLATFVVGDAHYHHTVRTQRGTLSVFYGSMTVADDLRLAEAAAVEPPRFPEFAAYRAYLVNQARMMFANAADPARVVRYRPLAVISAGYDSPASAVIAREAGCTEALTFGQPFDKDEGNDDSGTPIARALGLQVAEYRTHAYRSRDDQPEIEFASASFSGGQVYMASTEAALRERIVVSGYGGDFVWDRGFGVPKPPRFPMAIGGYSQNEFFTRQPALDFAIPAVGMRNAADIGSISRSPAMAPWSIGGDYDRPIARRIIEKAGVARGLFATVKRRVTPDYDNFARRTVDLATVLTPASLAAFEAWFARERPIRRGRVLRHKLLLGTLGHVFWSNKLRRMLRRRGIAWPPCRTRVLRLKVPVRRNPFVFTWAVGEQALRYRDALTRGGL